MSSDEVREAHRKWQESAKPGTDDDSESLRKFLVARKHLTEYQSHLVMRGHSEGFFLGEYKILDLIGKSPMAGIFKAATGSGQVVSLKVLPSSKAKEPAILSRFQREAKLLTKLDHANVVRAFQCGEAGGRHYIVMEYLEGETLDEVLARRKRLPAAEAVRIVYQALLGLQNVFEKAMVHRDLKPSNLLLVPAPTQGPDETTFDSTVKILDIGLGRTTFDESSREPETRVTSEGTLLGGTDYLAPEQARSAHEADIRADIYSLGCILFQLLTGQVPFPDPNTLSQIVKHATEPPPPLANLVPQLPDGLQQVVNWMMAKDPNQRYPTPARAAQALQVFLRQPSAPAGEIAPDQVKDPIVSGAADAPRIPVGRLETEPRRKEPRKEAAATVKKAGAVTEPFGAPPLADDDEYDVEIIGPPPKKQRALGEPRSLLELDRRDYIMAGIGGGLVLTAILAGYGLSRLFRNSSPAGTTPVEQQPPDSAGPPREKKPTDKIESADSAKKDETPKDEMKKDDARKDAVGKD
jgi:serine/threonine protein kinase